MAALLRKHAIPVVVLVVGLLAVSYFWNNSSAYERRAAAAVAIAEALKERADSAIAAAAQDSARADSLARVAERAERSVRVRVDSVRVMVEVPDTCAPYIAQRDSLIDDALEAAEKHHEATIAERLVSAGLRSVVAELEVANDTLLSVLKDRPKPRPKWLPSLGVVVGACTGGGFPCAAVGLSWQLW